MVKAITPNTFDRVGEAPRIFAEGDSGEMARTHGTTGTAQAKNLTNKGPREGICGR